MESTATQKFNGWKNYETWNIALYIENERELYEAAKAFDSYIEFAECFIENGGSLTTPDGVDWISNLIDLDELNEHIQSITY